jgi:sulfopyruvate decarboxylase subunit beta
MGLRLPGLLDGAGIPWTEVNVREDFAGVARGLPQVYDRGAPHAFLLSPAVWEGSDCRGEGATEIGRRRSCRASLPEAAGCRRDLVPVLTRFEILKLAAPLLVGKVVVQPRILEGAPPSGTSFEFHARQRHGISADRPRGALASDCEIVVVDGDGSLLMNPGTLAVVAASAPKNLTILAIDNGAYGSTGSQPTHAAGCVDLEQVARGLGIADTVKTAGGADLIAAMGARGEGPRFIHALAVPGNEDVPNIPLGHLENKRQVMAFLRETR